MVATIRDAEGGRLGLGMSLILQYDEPTRCKKRRLPIVSGGSGTVETCASGGRTIDCSGEVGLRLRSVVAKNLDRVRCHPRYMRVG